MSTLPAPGPLSGLAGRLLLCPGAPLGHSLASSRPAGLVRLLRGQPADALPGLLASLFSLCGQVHRLGAALALRAAATGQPATATHDERRLLQLHTLRSQAQGVLMDWPRWLAADTAAACDAGLALLGSSPLRTPWPLRSANPAGAGADPHIDPHIDHHTDHHAAWAAWLASQVFQQPLADWLAAWQADPQAALQAWVARAAARSPVARWLQQAQPWAGTVLHGQAALLPHAQPGSLAALLADQLAQPRPAPQWHGCSADTGPWARLADSGRPPLPTPWLRLGARLADLAQLALPDGPAQGLQRLALGAVPLLAWPAPLGTDAVANAVADAGAGPAGGHGAIAWVETGRGLLLQALWLAPPVAGAAPVLQHALVLAPTDWNAHPAGAWARALAALPGDAPAAAVGALVAAYDPCVPCLVDPAAAAGASLREASHA